MVEDKKLKAILDNLPESITRFDLNFRYIYVNRRFETNNNLRSVDVLGKTFWELGFPPRVCSYFERRFKNVIRTGRPITVEFPYSYDHSRQRLSSTITPELDIHGKIKSLLVSTRNITEIKKTEILHTKFLIEQKELFKTFFTRSPAIMILFQGPDFVISEANPLALKVLGESREIIGKPLRTALPEISGQGFIKILENVYHTGKAFTGYEMPARLDRNNDGRLETGYFNIVYEPVFDKKQKVTGIFEHAVDVTAQVLSRKKNEENEYKFRDISDNISQLVWIARPDGYRIWFNRRWLDFTGCQFHEAEGWKWVKYYHPDHRPRVIRRMKQVFKSGEIWEDIFPICRHDGVYRWFLARAVPIKDDNGRVLRWFGSSTDITKQLNAEEALRKSERFFRTAFSNANVGVTVTDAVGKFQYVNPSYEKITGYTLGELFRMKIQDIIFPDDLRKIQPLLKKLTKNKFPGYVAEIRYLKKDGHTVWVRKSISAVHDRKNNLVNVVSIIEDITERKSFEENLSAEKEQFQKLIDTIPILIIIYDTRLNISYFNKYFTKLVGWTTSDAQSSGFLKKIFPDFTLRQEVTDFLKSSAQTWKDFTLTTKKGQPLATSWQTIRFSSGIHIGIGIDITQRKELEQKKDEFVSMASHELKTPITSLKVLVEIMSEKLRRVGDQENLLLAQRMGVQLNRIVSLVSDLLDVTKIQSGKMSMSMEKFNINVLIQDIVTDISAANKNNNNIVIQSTTNREVFADRFRIGQVITNFLTNAIKYSPRESKITVSAFDEDENVVIYVKDNGFGIPRQDFANVFERFFQGKGPRSDEGRLSSLGLGLYISAEIIRKHNGRIWVNSKVGKGSTFYFSLPALP